MPLKKFKGHLTRKQVIKKAPAKGWTVNSDQYDIGSDWLIVFVTLADRPDIDRVLYAPFSGRFIGDGFSSDSELDGQPWFDELLNFFYVGEQPATQEQA